MKNNLFFKPTPLYREYLILDMIDKNKNITQRSLSEFSGVALSTVNQYLVEYESLNFITKNKISVKEVEYLLTSKGIDRKRLLSMWYLKDSYRVYENASKEIVLFLNSLIEKNIKSILLYGAGEVSQIIIQVINHEKDYPLRVVGLIDDDINKVGTTLLNIPIYNKEDIINIKHESVLVSSYTHRKVINSNLMNLGYLKKNIINFFDEGE